jgi:hypothetical protein
MSGIGSEILCVLSGGLDVSGHEETDPRYVAAERIARRWLTVRGSASWAPTMGLGLSILVNHDLSRGDLARLEGEARQEALAEDGARSARVTASISEGRLALRGVFRLDVSGEFTLTVSADGATEVILS